MTDTPDAGTPPQQQPNVKFNTITQYIRDMSFENVLSRKPQGSAVQPDVQVQVGLDAKKREAEHQYEVKINLNITSKAKDGTDILFIMELEYVGVFHVEGVPEAQLHAFLLIECPRQLFPYLRRIVGDVTRDGGFPPLNLENIDFLQLYRQEITRRTQQASTETAQA
jgi:preprotein translocase subunit SecB